MFLSTRMSDNLLYPNTWRYFSGFAIFKHRTINKKTLTTTKKAIKQTGTSHNFMLFKRLTNKYNNRMLKFISPQNRQTFACIFLPKISFLATPATSSMYHF